MMVDTALLAIIAVSTVVIAVTLSWRWRRERLSRRRNGDWLESLTQRWSGKATCPPTESQRAMIREIAREEAAHAIAQLKQEAGRVRI